MQYELQYFKFVKQVCCLCVFISLMESRTQVVRICCEIIAADRWFGHLAFSCPCSRILRLPCVTSSLLRF